MAHGADGGDSANHRSHKLGAPPRRPALVAPPPPPSAKGLIGGRLAESRATAKPPRPPSRSSAAPVRPPPVMMPPPSLVPPDPLRIAAPAQLPTIAPPHAPRAVPPPPVTSVPSRALHFQDGNGVRPFSGVAESGRTADALSSIPPVAYGSPPSTQELSLGAKIGIAATFAFALFAAGFVLVPARLGPARGALVVTVGDTGSAPVAGVRVVVDGRPSCEQSPCRIDGLESGAHTVRILAPGYEPTADVAVAVPRHGESIVNVELAQLASAAVVRTPASPAAPAAAVPPVAEATRTVNLDDLPGAGSDQPSAGNPERSRSSAEHASASPDQKSSTPNAAEPNPKLAAQLMAASGQEPSTPAGGDPGSGASSTPGTLSIDSTPSANVVIDGRPVGKTPLPSLSVAAGSHTIVLIDASGARKVQSLTLAPGASKAVSVRFEQTEQ